MEDPAYLRFEDLVFTGQSVNGVHLHDGDTYVTPAHHIVFESCWFLDMASDGNNDFLKASGLDSFEVTSCRFLNGAHGGGSGMDMVGCHCGVIRQSTFGNIGNALQTKGGSRWIRVERNRFSTITMRGVNIGGSTDIPLFRPIDARFEAADVQVYANIFIACTSPVCYVGCTNVDVVNNTIFDPRTFVIRILQETVDPSRFVACGNSRFRNNIIGLGNAVTAECNIGPDTDPQSFVFSNNLWYNSQNTSWKAPRDLPVPDSASIVGKDPLFVAAPQGDFSIPQSSPAFAKGFPVQQPKFDYAGAAFASPRSVGALEAFAALAHIRVVGGKRYRISVKQEGPLLLVERRGNQTRFSAEIFDARGTVIARDRTSGEGPARLRTHGIKPGTYLLSITDANDSTALRLVVP
jgi:hypothetical protein